MTAAPEWDTDMEDTYPGDFAWLPCMCAKEPCDVCSGTGRRQATIRRTASGEHRVILAKEDDHG